MSSKKVVAKLKPRELVRRLYEYFEKEKQNGGPMFPLNRIHQRVARALKLKLHSVTQIIGLEHSEGGSDGTTLKTPGKGQKGRRYIKKLDPEYIASIRRHTHEYCSSNEYPTLEKLHRYLKENSVFTGKKSSLQKVLHEVGFIYKRRKVVAEKADLTVRRRNFLKTVTELTDEQWDNVVFLDEMWFDIDTDQSTDRLLVCHAGKSSGFLETALLVKEIKSAKRHTVMPADSFEEWFKSVLISLEYPSIIVMDNAPYHCRQIDKAPTAISRKEQIVDWLKRRNVYAHRNMLKVTLMRLVKEHGEINNYVVDQMAIEHGHTVVRLPAYHSHFNAIELIWAQMKEYVNDDTVLELSDIDLHLLDSVYHITMEDWARAVEATRSVIVKEMEIETQQFVEIMSSGE